MVGALTAGVPSILLPMGADQPSNAARCAALGAGIALDVVRATPETVRAAAETVLADSAYRAAATRLRDEAAALPPPEHAVALLERLWGARAGGSATRGRARAPRSPGGGCP